MLRRLDLRGPLGDLGAVLPRPSTADDGPLDAVRAIIADVRERGDTALRELTARYDGVDLESVVVDPEDVASAPSRIDPVVLEALEVDRDRYVTREGGAVLLGEQASALLTEQRELAMQKIELRANLRLLDWRLDELAKAESLEERLIVVSTEVSAQKYLVFIVESVIHLSI